MSHKQPMHTSKEYKMKEGAEDFPLMVVLSFVYVCNARCPNCPYNNSTIRDAYRDALFMSERVFKRIADECGMYRAYLRLSGGGEPMLHPQAVDLICYAKDRGAKIGLISNGSRFTKDNLRTIISKGVDVIEFSVDAGDPQTYGVVRPGLNWEVVNEHARMAISIRNELSAPTNIIASIINQEGVDVEKAEAHWRGIVDNVQIRKYLTWGYNQDRSADTSAYLPPEERIPCPWLFERLNIDSRGEVTLCGEDIAFAYKFANIMDRSIKEIWSGPDFRRFRELHLARRGDQIPICAKCPDWQYRSWNHNYWKLIKNAEAKRHKSK